MTEGHIPCRFPELWTRTGSGAGIQGKTSGTRTALLETPARILRGRDRSLPGLRGNTHMKGRQDLPEGQSLSSLREKDSFWKRRGQECSVSWWTEGGCRIMWHPPSALPMCLSLRISGRGIMRSRCFRTTAIRGFPTMTLYIPRRQRTRLRRTGTECWDICGSGWKRLYFWRRCGFTLSGMSSP